MNVKVNKNLQILTKYTDRYVAYTDKIFNIVASGATIQDVEKILVKKKITKATNNIYTTGQQITFSVCP